MDSSEDLRPLPIEEQKNIMRNWFLESFEDPVRRTPYESAEGGYIYILGGPFYPRDELFLILGGVPVILPLKNWLGS